MNWATLAIRKNYSSLFVTMLFLTQFLPLMYSTVGYRSVILNLLGEPRMTQALSSCMPLHKAAHLLVTHIVPSRGRLRK